MNVVIALFEAAYTDSPARRMGTAIDPRLMILPHFCWRINLALSRHIRNVPRKLVFMMRAALSSGQTVTLAAAIRSARGSVRGRGSREVVKARLCREPNGLVYLLTLLTRDGKVTHTAVDATSGKVVDLR